MKTFSGTVAASTSQSGIGTAKIRKPIGNARTRSAGHPAEISTQPTMTGIKENVSKVTSPCWISGQIEQHQSAKESESSP